MSKLVRALIANQASSRENRSKCSSIRIDPAGICPCSASQINFQFPRPLIQIGPLERRNPLIE